jgi:2-methylcitrate dehydratase PrpD
MMRCIDKPCSVKDSAAIGAFSAAMAFCMIEQNLTGLESILTAEDCGRELIESFGSEWMIMKQYFKPYPVCRWTQPSVEAILELKKKHSFNPDEIEEIEVEIFDAGARLVYFPPQDSDQAQYSLPWAVGCAIVDGKLGLAQVHQDKLKDKTILSLGRKLKTKIADDIQKRFPKECLSRVNLHLKNGSILKSSTHQARGDYNNPLSAEEYENKAAELFGFAVDKKHYTKISHAIENLENTSADQLLELL